MEGCLPGSPLTLESIQAPMLLAPCAYTLLKMAHVQFPTLQALLFSSPSGYATPSFFLLLRTPFPPIINTFTHLLDVTSVLFY